ncbi:hypothetical protein B0H67DRAFT_493997 [Lasiosphaeris hirsuta]|uniref:Cellobiose dehydrogenase-like cytochrome domain-containing protein n=1 Tax=Lasiosphaeris hirsuta TaxID=260670 RepID=A0AA40DPH5_9PEZI|nr:hypothetical protein B0H67DRAFT_493997 [Lasiosphaeris hirsuta]
MGFLQLAAAALALTSSVSASPVPVPEPQAVAAVSAKVCDAATTICFSEWISPEKISYRVAIPDTATAGTFDVLLQIVAPKTVGWAGIAWGGTMTNNPLAVAWANGATAVITSRKASARTYPQVSADSSYTVLPGSGSNTTHWYITALSKGVSSWGTTKLDPASSAVSFAYAQSAAAVTEPANPASRFSIHQSRGKFTIDLAGAKVANFAALVEKASKPAAI